MRALLLGASIAAPPAFSQGPAAAAAIVRYEGDDRERRLADGARAEGEVSIYTSLTVEEVSALSEAFEKKYGVRVRSWRAGSEKVLQRALTEARAGRHEVDAIETNGPELEALYREKLLIPLQSPQEVPSQACRSRSEIAIHLVFATASSGFQYTQAVWNPHR